VEIVKVDAATEIGAGSCLVQLRGYLSRGVAQQDRVTGSTRRDGGHLRRRLADALSAAGAAPGDIDPGALPPRLAAGTSVFQRPFVTPL